MTSQTDKQITAIKILPNTPTRQSRSKTYSVNRIYYEKQFPSKIMQKRKQGD